MIFFFSFQCFSSSPQKLSSQRRYTVWQTKRNFFEAINRFCLAACCEADYCLVSRCSAAALWDRESCDRGGEGETPHSISGAADIRGGWCFKHGKRIRGTLLLRHTGDITREASGPKSLDHGEYIFNVRYFLKAFLWVPDHYKIEVTNPFTYKTKKTRDKARSVKIAPSLKNKNNKSTLY